MSVEANKELVHRLFDDLDEASRGNAALIAQYYHPDFMSHTPLLHIEPGAGLAELHAGSAYAGERIKELDWELQQVIAEGDYVTTRWTLRLVIEHALTVRHLGDVAPGHDLLISGVTIGRVQDGKLIEIWQYDDHQEVFLRSGVTLTPEQPVA